MKTMWIQFQKPSIVSILEIAFSGLPFDFISLSMKKKKTHRDGKWSTIKQIETATCFTTTVVKSNFDTAEIISELTLEVKMLVC